MLSDKDDATMKRMYLIELYIKIKKKLVDNHLSWLFISLIAIAN